MKSIFDTNTKFSNLIRGLAMADESNFMDFQAAINRFLVDHINDLDPTMKYNEVDEKGEPLYEVALNFFSMIENLQNIDESIKETWLQLLCKGLVKHIEDLDDISQLDILFCLKYIAKYSSGNLEAHQKLVCGLIGDAASLHELTLLNCYYPQYFDLLVDGCVLKAKKQLGLNFGDLVTIWQTFENAYSTLDEAEGRFYSHISQLHTQSLLRDQISRSYISFSGQMQSSVSNFSPSNSCDACVSPEVLLEMRKRAYRQSYPVNPGAIGAGGLLIG